MPEVLLSSAGVSKSLLDQIDLQDIDVIKGKKYIGSDGKLHTGSLEDQQNDNQCPVVTKFDPDTNFVYLAIPKGAYRKTDGRMSPHPNIKRRLREIVGEAGFNRGQYQYAGGIGSGTDERGKYYALNKIPEGFYSSNGADWAPEVRISEEKYLGFVPGGNRGAWGTTINPGGSVTIPQGWHNGSGKVTANNPASNWNMRYFGGNADNQYHSQRIGAPDGNGTYAWGCSAYIYMGNENSHLSFNFYDQSYDKWGNNNNFMFYGTNYFDGNTTLGYSIWGGNLNFYYCRVR